MRSIKSVPIYLFLFLYFHGSWCLAARDVFAIEQKKDVSHQLMTFKLQDLTFVGSVIAGAKSVGFVEDRFGNIHAVSLGQYLTKSQVRVIKILNDQILLANERYYAVIK